MAQARDAGIIVVSHEAVGIENVDIDIEGFENTAYGAQIMENLGECTSGEGEYVQFVGRLTNGSHSEWVEGAYDKQQADFPDMTRVEDPIESEENEEVAYNKAKEILAKYPDIKGFQGSAGTDVVGHRPRRRGGRQDRHRLRDGHQHPLGRGRLPRQRRHRQDLLLGPRHGRQGPARGRADPGRGRHHRGGHGPRRARATSRWSSSTGADNAFAGDAGVAVDLENVAEYDF